MRACTHSKTHGHAAESGWLVPPALTCILRELGSAARQAVSGRPRVVAAEQSRGDKSHMQKEKSQEQQLHPVCNSRHTRAKVAQKK